MRDSQPRSRVLRRLASCALFGGLLLSLQGCHFVGGTLRFGGGFGYCEPAPCNVGGPVVVVRPRRGCR